MNGEGYAVVLYNDDVNSRDYVKAALIQMLAVDHEIEAKGKIENKELLLGPSKKDAVDELVERIKQIQTVKNHPIFAEMAEQIIEKAEANGQATVTIACPERAAWYCGWLKHFGLMAETVQAGIEN